MKVWCYFSKKVVIVRDREAAGGGIFNYYQAVGRHLRVEHEFVGVGRSHGFYSSGDGSVARSLPTPLRLLIDWASLGRKLIGFPDLVHLNPGLDIKSRKSLRRDAVSLILAKLLFRKVLVFWRGWDNDACGTPEFPGGNRGWLSWAYRLADAHVVLASDFKEDLRRWGFGTPIFLETTVVSDAVLEGGEVVRLDGGFNILFLSRVEIAKGVFEMLDAMALLEKRRPGDFRLTVAGDGPALEEMKARASATGLKGIVFKGYVNGGEKSQCFREASAFCFLSYTEGMPNAVLEAMAMGLPLVSSDAGGLKDILTDGVTGHILKQDKSRPAGERFTAGEVADRLEQLADLAETSKRMGEHNRVFARERFTAAKVAARLEAIYRNVIAGNPGRGAGE